MKNLKNLNLKQATNITRTAPSPRPAPDTKREPGQDLQPETEPEPEPEKSTDLTSYRNNQNQKTGPEPAENQIRTST